MQNAAAAGITEIRSYSAGFRVLASSFGVTARQNTATTGAGANIPIYWLDDPDDADHSSVTSLKVADDYTDFYDGTLWDNETYEHLREEDGTKYNGGLSGRVWTGSNADGTRAGTDYLGTTNDPDGHARLGDPGEAGSGRHPIASNHYTVTSTARSLYGLSQVFTVGTPTVLEISIGFPTGEGISGSGRSRTVNEDFGGMIFEFEIVSTTTPAADLNVCIRVTESGADRVPMTNEGIQTPHVVATTNEGLHQLMWEDDGGAISGNSSVLVEALAPGTAGCDSSVTAGSYTVSTTEGSGTLVIEDNEKPNLVSYDHFVGGWFVRPDRDILLNNPQSHHGYGLMDYRLYIIGGSTLSNTITVTATVSDFTKAGLSLTEDGAPVQSLTLTFETRGPTDAPNTGYYGCGPYERGGDGYDVNKGDGTDGNASTSNLCVRQIFVVRKLDTSQSGCVDITHTATGTGLADVEADRTTIRAHLESDAERRAGTTPCSWITPDSIRNHVRTPSSQRVELPPPPLQATTASDHRHRHPDPRRRLRVRWAR